MYFKHSVLGKVKTCTVYESDAWNGLTFSDVYHTVCVRQKKLFHIFIRLKKTEQTGFPPEPSLSHPTITTRESQNKVSPRGLLNIFAFCPCQSFHPASQHQWLRRLSLQVCGRVAGVHQDEPVQRKLQHSGSRQHGAGATDEERVSSADLLSVRLFSTQCKRKAL